MELQNVRYNARNQPIRACQQSNRKENNPFQINDCEAGIRLFSFTGIQVGGGGLKTPRENRTISHCGSKVSSAGRFLSILRSQRLASNQIDFGLIICRGSMNKNTKTGRGSRED